MCPEKRVEDTFSRFGNLYEIPTLFICSTLSRINPIIKKTTFSLLCKKVILPQKFFHAH